MKMYPRIRFVAGMWSGLPLALLSSPTIHPELGLVPRNSLIEGCGRTFGLYTEASAVPLLGLAKLMKQRPWQ